MPTSSSLNHRRSVDGSQAGTRGNGLAGSGALSRDRNTSQTEDTTTSNRNGRNNLSEQIQGTSPESRRVGNHQGPTNAPAARTCEQQSLYDRNTVERDGLRDPEENRKRKLSQAITEILVSSLKKLKTEKNSDVLDLYRGARTIARFVGPFVNIRTTFVNGSQLTSTLLTPPEAPTELTAKERALLNIYDNILTVVPGLYDQTKWVQMCNPCGIHELATFLDKLGNKGRSDDCATLREDAIGYIRPVNGVPVVDRLARKDTRGFSHHATARLLCPRHLRDEFDEDRDKFCRDVQNGNRIIIHDDWPSFLYPEEGYDPDAINWGLLRGPFLVSCYRHVFTGARTAMKATPGKAPGKKCVADLYNMTEVTPITIAYTAALCRHVLNSKESWCMQDGNFHSDIFFQNIVDLFDDEEWGKETLTWWTDYVFGNNPRAHENTTPKDCHSAVARLAAQRAARQKAPADGSPSDAEESMTEDSGPEPVDDPESMTEDSEEEELGEFP